MTADGRATDLRSNDTVLDVACGNGNATRAAARRCCTVTGIDYMPALLARAEERMRAERFPVTLLEADAENLPFANAGFEAALSTFGVMFTADHAQAARCSATPSRPTRRSARSTPVARWHAAA